VKQGKIDINLLNQTSALTRLSGMRQNRQGVARASGAAAGGADAW